MYANYLKSKFPNSQIVLQVVAIPGYTSNEAIEWWDKYMVNSTPDIVFLGWGMNDQNTSGPIPKEFKKNLTILIEMIRKRKGAEVALFSTFPPNDYWLFNRHKMKKYAEITKAVASDNHCAYVDVYGAWDNVLKRKDKPSLLSNNINHPNDFGHWIYEQAFEAMSF